MDGCCCGRLESCYHQIAIVVSNLQDQCARYWPEALHVTEKQGSYTLELLSENTFEDYVVRELKLTDVTVSPQQESVDFECQTLQGATSCDKLDHLPLSTSFWVH